jgi:hypothetical protein
MTSGSHPIGEELRVSRHHTGRFAKLFATAATALLLAAAMLPGLASAADTRDLTIGSPALPANDGVLIPTRVTVPATGKGPYATMFKVQILNGGGQNLAHTVLTINADATGSDGLSLATTYDPDGGNDADSTFCSTSGDIITCDYANLGAGLERTVAVVVGVTEGYVASVPAAPLFTAFVTTNNENGSNTQTFPASSGGFVVEPTGANTVSTFVLDGVVGQNLTTSDATGSGNKLNTNVTFNTSAKELVQINEGTSTAALYPCPAGLSCQPDFSEVTTTSGSFATTPFFTWRLTAIVPKTYALSQGFLAHFPTGATTSDWILYFKNKSAMCGTDIEAKIASAGQCIRTLSLTKFDRTSNLLVIEAVMDHQGGTKY